MKILWLNWKDIKHPWAGGTENYTHQIAKRLRMTFLIYD